MVSEAGITLEVVDTCGNPGPVEVSIQTDLTDGQERALDALVPHDLEMPWRLRALARR